MVEGCNIAHFRFIGLHFLFREMEAKGGLTYKSADRTVQQLSHDALPKNRKRETLDACINTIFCINLGFI